LKKSIAIIPLRKNSKGIKNKNKNKLIGRPLYSWALGAAIFSELDEVYIYSDDKELLDFINKEYYWSKKVKTILRPDFTATDTASTELAMIEFVKELNKEFATITLLQATSPLTSSLDINNSLDLIIKKGYDSSITVVKTKRFFWNDKAEPLNYDYNNRPRRQDFKGCFVENGAVYTTTSQQFLSSKNRIGGNIGLVEMLEETYYEIDSMSDWMIVERLLMNRLRANKNNTEIKYLVLDVDGVFTDGTVYFNAEGESLKKFDMRDGMGLEILREYRVEIIVMTSEKSKLVQARMKKLKIKNLYMGVKDKFSLLKKIILDKNENFSAFAYVGDDVNDLANMSSCGWSFAPSNATEVAKVNSDLILKNKSGDKAIREVTEFIKNYNKRYE